jgi:integrase
VRKRVDQCQFAAAVCAAKPGVGEDVTFRELAMAFAASKSAQTDDRGRLSIWMGAIGDVRAWEVTAAHLRTGIALYEEADYSPGYQNRLLNTVGSVFKWAIAQGKAPSGFISPTLQVKRKPEEPRVFVAPPEKIEKLRAQALGDNDRRFACWVLALIDTGARKSEITDRVWSEIDLDAGTIALPGTASKTGRGRVLHLSPATCAVWKRTFLHRAPGDRPFASRLGAGTVQWRKRWNKLCIDADLEGMHPHDLRKAAAAKLLTAGVGIGRAAQVIGNSARTLERFYGHLDSAALGDVATVLHQRSRRFE